MAINIPSSLLSVQADHGSTQWKETRPVGPGAEDFGLSYLSVTPISWGSSGAPAFLNITIMNFTLFCCSVLVLNNLCWAHILTQIS